MKRPLIIGVMGGGNVDAEVADSPYELGALITREGWILLNGGRNAGVMAASARGARENGGLTIGILPDHDTSQMAPDIQIPICTGMGSARNTINLLSCDMVVACPGGAGTTSEIAIALKHAKRVICMGFDPGRLFAAYLQSGQPHYCATPHPWFHRLSMLKLNHCCPK